MYFVPSGRVGFKRPNGIAPWSNVWALSSTDHTFDVRITQMPRLDPDSDSYLWDKDDRSELIQTDIKCQGLKSVGFATSDTTQVSTIQPNL
jgi:hypothetical protein